MTAPLSCTCAGNNSSRVFIFKLTPLALTVNPSPKILLRTRARRHEIGIVCGASRTVLRSVLCQPLSRVASFPGPEACLREFYPGDGTPHVPQNSHARGFGIPRVDFHPEVTHLWTAPQSLTSRVTVSANCSGRVQKLCRMPKSTPVILPPGVVVAGVERPPVVFRTYSFELLRLSSKLSVV